jgi:NAD(P)-dependent dehydrogenase (short-subunit alcohol dehydrogenase family)
MLARNDGRLGGSMVAGANDEISTLKLRLTKAALIVGAGDATGGAIARRFAREGYVTCVTRRFVEHLEPLVAQIRADGGLVHAFGSDARDEQAVSTLFSHIEQEIAPIEVVVFNIGANVRFDVTETTERVYRKVWEAGALAGFLVGREAARVMLARGYGTILFTGATASVRGGAGFSAFAGAKHALRALAQSMARELGPQGLHVAHVVIDGAIDTPWIRANFPERYKLKDRDGILSPDAIADSYWMLHQQPRSAWTHELDLRPWIEPW